MSRGGAPPPGYPPKTKENKPKNNDPNKVNRPNPPREHRKMVRNADGGAAGAKPKAKDERDAVGDAVAVSNGPVDFTSAQAPSDSKPPVEITQES